MSRSLSPAHVDEATLLRLVLADLDATEYAAAERHLRQCATCRREKSRTEILDAAMRETAANAARPADAPGVFPPDDPFFRRPQESHRLAKEAGLDVRALAEAAAEASVASAPRTSALLKTVKGDKATLDAALTSIRFDSLADRLALSGALSEAFDRVEDNPAAYRHFAEAALDRISKEPAVEGLSEMRPKPEEYAAPLVRLAAEAQLLASACELLHAEFDAAREGLEAAWRSLDGGRDALPLVARMETIASILRTVSGKPAEGLALAERAAETFAATGHPVDAARAEFVKGLAELAAGSTREGNVSLRRARGAFARSGAWGAFALTVTALAVAETGPSDGPELKGLFRASLGRLRRAGALDAFQFLRATHRVVLLTRREPKRAKGKGTARKAVDPLRFEPSLPYLMRGGDLLADGIVCAARESDDALRDRLRALDGHAARGFALLRGCQGASNIVVENPHRALMLAHLISESVEMHLNASVDQERLVGVHGQTVRAEAKIVESQGQVQLGFAQKSRDAAFAARACFESAGHTGFGQVLAEYFEGQAAGFAKDYAAAERLLKKALRSFGEFGQDQLAGRVGASLGTLYLQRGDPRLALPFFDQALGAFDPVADERPMAATLNNRAITLSRLGRYDEARGAYARALNVALKRNMKALVLVIREGLAETDFRRGLYEKALAAFSCLWDDSIRAGFQINAVSAQLYVAECLGRLGRRGDMAKLIRALRRAQTSGPFSPSRAMEELFFCLDQGTLDADLVRNVREHLEREQSDERTPGRLMRVVS